MVDGADCKLYSKRNPLQTVDVQYRLSYDDERQSLDVMMSSSDVEERRVAGCKYSLQEEMSVVDAPVRHLLASDVTIKKSSTRSS